MKKDRTPAGFCWVGAKMRTPKPRALGSLSHRVIAPLAGAGGDSTRSFVSLSAMETAASVIRQRPGWVPRCGILRVFAVYCKPFTLISGDFPPSFGISRQSQELG